ncbi:MAG: SRPBCC domain-containing protein [Ornithinibacter sp.]
MNSAGPGSNVTTGWPRTSLTSQPLPLPLPRSLVMGEGIDEFTYRRLHACPRNLVFVCMTTPAHLSKFWGRAGTHTPEDRIVVELRPGGAFETTIVDDKFGSEHTMRAVYEEVDPPSTPDTGLRNIGHRCALPVPSLKAV